jgi:hypothetical protein
MKVPSIRPSTLPIEPSDPDFCEILLKKIAYTDTSTDIYIYIHLTLGLVSISKFCMSTASMLFCCTKLGVRICFLCDDEVFRVSWSSKPCMILTYFFSRSSSYGYRAVHHLSKLYRKRFDKKHICLALHPCRSVPLSKSEAAAPPHNSLPA